MDLKRRHGTRVDPKDSNLNPTPRTLFPNLPSSLLLPASKRPNTATCCVAAKEQRGAGMRTWHGVTDCRGRFEEQPEAVNRTNMQPLFWSQCNAYATLGVPYHEEVRGIIYPKTYSN